MFFKHLNISPPTCRSQCSLWLLWTVFLLIGGFKHGFYFPLYMGCHPNPIDELVIFFKMRTLHHQASKPLDPTAIGDGLWEFMASLIPYLFDITNWSVLKKAWPLGWTKKTWVWFPALLGKFISFPCDFYVLVYQASKRIKQIEMRYNIRSWNSTKSVSGQLYLSPFPRQIQWISVPDICRSAAENGPLTLRTMLMIFFIMAPWKIEQSKKKKNVV